jgi:hypothetical protein
LPGCHRPTVKAVKSVNPVNAVNPVDSIDPANCLCPRRCGDASPRALILGFVW